tara:strand:+ start:972 stop:1823 length:852 start_codon:yes stop_codon:yes gene_type:complete
MKQALITGATGFVGKHVLRILKSKNINLTAVIRNGKEKKDIEFSSIKNIITTNNLFLENSEWWEEKCRGIDIVIHIAWYTEPGKYQNSTKNLECLIGSLNLAKGAIKAGVKKFVGIGTCFEYDLIEPVLSTDSPLKPSTPYADAKTALYLTLNHLLPMHNIEFNWCRLFYLFGEGEDARRLTPYLHSQLKKNKIAELSSGKQIRDFLDVADAAKMIVEVIFGKKTGPFNICSGIPITIRQFAENIADEYGKRNLLKFNVKPDDLTNPLQVLGEPSVDLKKIVK